MLKIDLHHNRHYSHVTLKYLMFIVQLTKANITDTNRLVTVGFTVVERM